MVMAVLGVKNSTLVKAPRNKPFTPYCTYNLRSASTRPVYVASLVVVVVLEAVVVPVERWI